MNLDQKNIVLTGAASGIGFEILQALKNKNVRIIAADIHSQNLKKAIGDVPDCHAFVADLSKPEEIDRLFDFTIQKIETIDLFIANAGFAYYEKLENPDWEHQRKIIDLNFNGPVYSAVKMAALNKNRSYKTVFISSAMAYWATPGYSLYSASKAALKRFADGFRFETPSNSFSIAYPIATNTNFFNAAGELVPRSKPMQEPYKVAQRIIKGIEKDRFQIYPSRLFRISYHLNKIISVIKPVFQHQENQRFKKWLCLKK
ncbi:MAG: SDR family NAD(P)-dependent oxidoreductase [Candidatus Aminicenantes bacterium]|nr:SDR family NAD(P)-dependent oxidoreductase [Candidatus Aminicenantes bacterium]